MQRLSHRLLVFFRVSADGAVVLVGFFFPESQLGHSSHPRAHHHNRMAVKHVTTLWSRSVRRPESIVARSPFDAPDRDSPLWPIKSLTSVRCLSRHQRPDYADNNLPLCSPLSPFIIQLLHFSFFVLKRKKKPKKCLESVPFELVSFAPLVAPSVRCVSHFIFHGTRKKLQKKKKRKEKTANNFVICRRPAELF